MHLAASLGQAHILSRPSDGCCLRGAIYLLPLLSSLACSQLNSQGDLVQKWVRSCPFHVENPWGAPQPTQRRDSVLASQTRLSTQSSPICSRWLSSPLLPVCSCALCSLHAHRLALLWGLQQCCYLRASVLAASSAWTPLSPDHSLPGILRPSLQGGLPRPCCLKLGLPHEHTNMLALMILHIDVTVWHPNILCTVCFFPSKRQTPLRQIFFLSVLFIIFSTQNGADTKQRVSKFWLNFFSLFQVWSGVLVPRAAVNKVPQTRWFTTADIYCLTVLKDRVWKQGVCSAIGSLWYPWKRTLTSPSSFCSFRCSTLAAAQPLPSLPMAHSPHFWYAHMLPPFCLYLCLLAWTHVWVPLTPVWAHVHLPAWGLKDSTPLTADYGAWGGGGFRGGWSPGMGQEKVGKCAQLSCPPVGMLASRSPHLEMAHHPRGSLVFLLRNNWIKDSAPCLKEQILKELVEHEEGHGCQFSSFQNNKCGCTFLILPLSSHYQEFFLKIPFFASYPHEKYCVHHYVHHMEGPETLISLSF